MRDDKEYKEPESENLDRVLGRHPEPRRKRSRGMLFIKIK